MKLRLILLLTLVAGADRAPAAEAPKATPAHSLDIAAKAGIAKEKIVLDPGIGFGKTPEQSISVIAKLDTFRRFGLPLLLGASRKRFIDHVSPSGPMERIGGSLAAHVMAVFNGANIIRTHDVAETVQAIKVALAIRGAQ